ncbi:uncharacterized protein LOC144437392 [Glandiceps talaboti]
MVNATREEAEIVTEETRKLHRNSHVLVFGGNGFIGAETVVALISEGYTVAIVNRGNWYWDSETRVKPFVTHVMCDRNIDLLRCDPLTTLIKEVGHFDFVVDFSAYNGYQMESAVRALAGKVGLYIYISTDSVYEVCTTKKHKGKTKETDAVRPSSSIRQTTLNQQDNYGHEKLSGEEVLRQYRETGGFPYVFLRLPDVVGPRDSTHRWWFYQLWIRTFDAIGTPLHVPGQLSDLPLCFVHVEDVAKVVLEIAQAGDKVYDEAFNIAFDETPTLVHVLKDMATAMGIKNVLFDSADLGNKLHLFPSVKRGAVDNSKIKDFVSWRPLPWKAAVEKTVTFYEEAMKLETFPQEIYDLINRFTSVAVLISDSKLKYFVQRVVEFYGPHLHDYFQSSDFDENITKDYLMAGIKARQEL